jgi:hypothetical protein
MTSSTRHITIVNFAIYVSRLSAVGGKMYPIPEKVGKSRNIIIYKEDDNLCVWFIIGILEEPTDFHSTNDRHKQQIARRTFTKYNPNIDIETYEGADIESVLVHFAEKLNKHFYIYIYNETKDQYKLKYDIGTNENPESLVNLLLLTNERTAHILFIKSHEKLMDCKICPTCRVFSVEKHDTHTTEWKFNYHVKNCDGTLKQHVILPNVPMPYLPHIMSNQNYARAVAKGEEYKPIRTYITYDFETAICPKNEKFGEDSVLVARLHPITQGSRHLTIFVICCQIFNVFQCPLKI